MLLKLVLFQTIIKLLLQLSMKKVPLPAWRATEDHTL